jgi:hypothetical protein
MNFVIMFQPWQETALLFFFSVGFWRWRKNKCAVCALAFSVQMFNFSTIFALLTTFGIWFVACFKQLI